jgi:hypothetical protein
MASVIAEDAVQLKARRISAHAFLPFDHGHARQSFAHQLKGSAHPSRSRTKYHYVG